MYKCSLFKIKICLEGMYKIYLNEIYNFNLENSEFKISWKFKFLKYVVIILILNYFIKGFMYEFDVLNSFSEVDERFESFLNFRLI